MINKGFVLLWRKLEDNPIYSNSKAVHIWVECLLRASYKERSFYKGREKIELKPGQFIMGYREFGDKLNIGASTVKYWLDKFEKVEQMIERKSNAKGTIVTINNWEEYQEVKQEVVQGQNDDRTEVECNNTLNKDKSLNNTTNNNHSGDQKSEDSPEFGEDSDPYKLAKLLWDRLTDFHDPVPGRVPDTDSPKDLDKWSKDMDKLLRLGPVGGDKGPSTEQVEYIIHWIYDINDFWRDTIQSPHGIRKNLSRITAQIRTYKDKKNGGNKFGSKSKSEYMKDLADSMNKENQEEEV